MVVIEAVRAEGAAGRPRGELAWGWRGGYYWVTRVLFSTSPSVTSPSVQVPPSVIGGLRRAAVAGLAAAGVALAMLTLPGCIESDVDPATDADTGSTHALLTIERTDLVEAELAPTPAPGFPSSVPAPTGAPAGRVVQTSTALAGFAHMPAGVDAAAVRALVGWNLELPEPGRCVRSTAVPEARPSLSPVDNVEFLEAGEVVVETRGEKTRLAPRNFPSVTDLISGVLYTTRHKATDLPPGALYRVRATGGLTLQTMEVSAEAPEAVAGITVGGVPLHQVQQIAVTGPVDLTWNVGLPSDLIYVELASSDGLGTTACTFPDSDGAGTIALGDARQAAGGAADAEPSETAMVDLGAGRIALHRVRTVALDGPGLEYAELRFDFAVAANVSFIGDRPVP